MGSQRIASWLRPTSPPPEGGRSRLPKSRTSKTRGASGARSTSDAKGAASVRRASGRGAARAASARRASGAPRVLAIAAHPDDIEFMMAGTLLLLRDAGWDTHYLNVSSGNLGSLTLTPSETARIRSAEAQ